MICALIKMKIVTTNIDNISIVKKQKKQNTTAYLTAGFAL